MSDTINQDIVMVELITAGSRLNKTDCYFIAGVIRGFIEGGDFTALRDALDYYFGKFQISCKMYHELIDIARNAREERILKHVSIN